MSTDTVTRRIMTSLEAAAKARMPTMLVGAPGTGKSSVIRALAESTGYELITLIGSRLDPTDVSGMPKGVVREIGDRQIEQTVYLAPHWQITILEKKRVILFLDEFSNTPAAVRASLLTLLQEREFPNGEKFPDETIIIGAMNPTEQAADGYELDLPTTNRIFFIPWKQTHDGWSNGMLTNWNRPASDEELAWKARIVGFIRDNPMWLHKEPEEMGSEGVYGISTDNPSEMEVARSAWASGRSWDNLSRVLSVSPDDTSIQDFIAQGIIGYAAAASFREWLMKNDIIKPTDVIANPESVDWSKVSLSDSGFLLRAIVELVEENNLDNVLRIFSKIAEDGREDMGAPYIQSLIRKISSRDFGGNPKENKRKLFPVVRQYHELTENAR